MRKLSLYWAPAFLYMALILTVSLRPMPEGLPDISGIDKLYHFGAYSLMGVLLMRALSVSSREAGEGRPGGARLVVAAGVISLIFGGFIEVLQSYTPDRSADIVDALSNGAGGFFGSFIYGRLSPPLSRRDKDAARRSDDAGV